MEDREIGGVDFPGTRTLDLPRRITPPPCGPANQKVIMDR
jgi:hypothetical protein